MRFRLLGQGTINNLMGSGSPVAEKYSWTSLGNRSLRCSTSCIHAVVIKKDGDELFDHYRHIPQALRNQKRLARADLQQVAEQV